MVFIDLHWKPWRGRLSDGTGLAQKEDLATSCPFSGHINVHGGGEYQSHNNIQIKLRKAVHFRVRFGLLVIWL